MSDGPTPKPDAPRGRDRRRGLERGVRGLCAAAVFVPLLALLAVLVQLIATGLGAFDRVAFASTLAPALVGSLSLAALTALLALPVGVGAAVALHEYGLLGRGDRRGQYGRHRLARALELDLAALAGVPSVIWGLLGLAVFVRSLGLGRSLLAGAATLALLVLPLVILAAREALRAVPVGLREAGLALGATRWQVTRTLVLPLALPGILAGAILALTRAIGEAAPLLLLGALAIDASFAALPVQIYDQSTRGAPALTEQAAAGILVLLSLLLPLAALALRLRERGRHRVRGGPG